MITDQECNGRHYLEKNIRRDSKRRKIEYNLNYAEFESLVTGECFYCGRKPSSLFQERVGSKCRCYYNGIDRVDNTIGYLSGNVVTCCRVCNKSKHTQTYDDFVLMCHKISLMHQIKDNI